MLGGGGVNDTFLVNRLDANGHTRPTFLCKPASKPGETVKTKVAGIPDGGEVIREAIAARAAQTFTSQTGIDVRMPESHVVALAGDMMPGGQPDDPPVTASIQEFGPGMEQIKKLTAQQTAAIPADQIAALAVFDLMTLNTDRHSGNIMCDAQGNMLPIDNGGCFVQREEGLARLAQTMGCPHNVLLKLPAAFDPRPDGMVRKLRAMKTSDYGASLKVDRDLIAAAHPDMLDMVADEALEWAQQAARFAKLAASNTPPLSPGGMQVAFSAHAAELLKAQDFDTVAKAVIAQAATHADTVRSVLLSDDIEHAELVRQVKALGWKVQERHGMPMPEAFADPVLMVTIVDGGIGKLQAALKATGDEDLLQIVEYGLYGATTGQAVRLIAALRDADAKDEPGTRAKAAGAIASYRDFLAGAPIVDLIEDNPFGVTVPLRRVLGGALDELDRQIAA